MKTIIVLGAGNGQIALVKWAKEHGFLAAVVSPKGDYPGFAIADKCLYHDIAAVDDIIADPLIAGDEIVAVVSSQLDQAVVPAAMLAKHFGVPGVGQDVAMLFTNKYEMRRRAAECGVAVPKCVHVLEIADLELAVEPLRFPVMIKPVDNAASRGVYKAKSLDELKRLFPLSVEESRQGVIIEEFVTGKEYVVEAFTCSGRIANLIVGHRDYFDVPEVFIPCATVFRDAESAIDPIEQRLKEVNEKLIRGFGLPFGVTHGEFIYNAEQDSIYLVEIAARGGGVNIASDLIPAASGVDADDIYMRASIGEDVPVPHIAHGAAAYFCFMLPEGTVTEINGADEVVNIPGVLRSVLSNVKIGTKVPAVRDKYSRKGPILVKALDKPGCYTVWEKVRKVLDIRTDSSPAFCGMIWS
ncbi:MAG: ATP-grasp domain-containing protein [Kiritimatiellae bacterium]|nr:ATP-grasp domain-containing protein [Kiritimatiellia bacterium]